MPATVRIAPVALLIVAAALVTLAAQVATPRGPLAARQILGGPVVTLDLPATDTGAFNAAIRILGAARVPFGAEGPALDPDVPLVDFAAVPDRSITLTGLTLGDALDAIVRANGRLRWLESDGVIVVRMANRNSFLDRRIRRYAVMDADVRGALASLMGQIAPARVTANGIAGYRSTTAEVEARLPARQGRDVTLALDNVILLDAMNAVARANGAMSWVVRYEQAPASVETASITFTESQRIAVAVPPLSDATSSSKPPVRIPIRGELVSMLTEYSRLTGVPIGVERIPGLSAIGNGSLPFALNLEGVPPAKAIAQIVAYDSRYEWTERSKRFLVRPRAVGARPALLDTRLPGFMRSNEPLEAVISGLIERMGVDNPRTQPMRLTGSPLPAGTLDAARLRLVSVSLRSSTTAREALDAICRSAGGLSWVLRSDYSNNGQDQYNLEITSAEGWRMVRSFSVPTPAPASVPTRAVTVPQELDRDIDRVSVGAPAASTAVRILTLSSAARVPVGVELIPAGAPPDPRLTVQQSSLPTQVGPGRFSDALYALLDLLPEYELAIADGVINVAPSGVMGQADHFLNRRIGKFAVTSMPASRVGRLLRQRMIAGGGRVLPDDEVPLTMGLAAIEQRVTLNLDNPTPREVLNAIVKQHGSLSWSISYEGTGGAVGRSREEDCVLRFVVARGTAPLAFQFARDGSVSQAMPAIAPTAPIALPVAETRRATLSLPIVTPMVEFPIINICRRLGITCSVELESEVMRRGPSETTRTTSNYDFTGMAGPEALDKLVALIPGLAWSQDGQIFRVRSQAIAKATELPLDRRVAVYERQINTQNEIFAAVQALFDSTRASPQPVTPPPGATINVIGGSPTSMERQFSVSLRDVTIRQILDELVRQHGGLTWGVRYIAANGLYPELTLTLSGDSGGSGRGIYIR